jgi:hypothetical protein
VDWQNWVKEQDQLIKNAQGVFAKNNLLKVNWSQVPSVSRYDVLDLARRLQLPYLIIKNLYPEIRVYSKSIQEVESRFVVLYAAALAKIGAFSESWELFDQVKFNSEVQPIVFLHMGMALLGQWNYAEGKKYFESYLHSTEVRGYQKLIGEINLASCLAVIGDSINAKKILKNFDRLQEEFPLLYLNSRELLLQIYSNEDNFVEAGKLCEFIRTKINVSGTGHYANLIRKWELINESRQAKQLHSEWSRFQRDAEVNKDYEIFRDLDFFKALIENDQALLMRLYLGTPYSAYKQRISSVSRNSSDEFYHCFLDFHKNLKKPQNSPVFFIDLNKEVIALKSINYQLPKRVCDLLRCLLKDFYRPIYLGDLFSSIYRGEYFNPFSSTKRLEKLIQRVQHYFRQFGIQLKIYSKNKTYWLQFNSDLRIRISNQMNYSDRTEIEHWLEKSGVQNFSRKQIQKILKVSKAKMNRTIRQLEQEAKLIRYGKGKMVRYQLNVKSKK